MAEFKQLQQAARLTNHDAAEILGVSERTITRYRAGCDVPANVMQELHTIAAAQVDRESCES